MGQSKFISEAVDVGYNYLSQTLEQLLGGGMRPSVGAMSCNTPSRTLRNVIKALYPHNHSVQAGTVLTPPDLFTIRGKPCPRVKWIRMNGAWLQLPHILLIRDGVNTCEFEAQGLIHTFTVAFDEKLGVVQGSLRSYDPTSRTHVVVPEVDYQLDYQTVSWGLKKPYRFPEGWT